MREAKKQIGFLIKFLSRKNAKRNFCGMTALLLLAACSQQEVIDSTSASLKTSCKAARNCTVYEPEGGAR